MSGLSVSSTGDHLGIPLWKGPGSAVSLTKVPMINGDSDKMVSMQNICFQIKILSAFKLKMGSMPFLTVGNISASETRAITP